MDPTQFWHRGLSYILLDSNVFKNLDNSLWNFVPNVGHFQYSILTVTTAVNFVQLMTVTILSH